MACVSHRCLFHHVSLHQAGRDLLRQFRDMLDGSCRRVGRKTNCLFRCAHPHFSVFLRTNVEVAFVSVGAVCLRSRVARGVAEDLTLERRDG